MSYKFKDKGIKNHAYYFSNDMINIKNLNRNKTKIAEKSCKSILICYIGCVTIKESRYVKINSVNPLYFFNNKINGYFEEIDGNKYLALVPTDERKEANKKYEEIWSKIKDKNRTITNKSGICEEKYMKIKFILANYLPSKKTLELKNMR